MSEAFQFSIFPKKPREDRQATHENREAGATGAERADNTIASSNDARARQSGNVVWHEQGCSFASDANAGAKPSATAIPGGDRRRRRRALISAPIRVRAVDVTLGGPDEISTTLDVSRNGVLFATSLPEFAQGMEVAVTFPYSKSQQMPLAEQFGRIVRVHQMPDGRRSVAIALGVGVGEDIVDAAGRTMIAKGVQPAEVQQTAPKKPLVLVVDADVTMREALKTQLTGEGYEVFAVTCAGEAREILKMFTPALVISEIEGADLPGLDLCAYCKTTPRLQAVPVMLMTSSAYPSDYSNAHSLGAVVCLAKPYRPERLAHVVRLLAPTQEHKQPVSVRPVDPSRCHRARRHGAKKSGGSSPPPSLEHRPPWRV